MARFFASVLTFCLLVVLGWPVLQGLVRAYPCFWYPGQCAAQDSYAADYYAGLTPIAKTLESRRWPAGMNLATQSGFDCTFAIVALDNRAPRIPPARRKTDVVDMEWGWAWRPVTILTAKDAEDLRSLLAICGVYWSASTVKLLDAGLSNRHMQVSGRSPYREVNLYLPPDDEPGLAARIRFGD